MKKLLIGGCSFSQSMRETDNPLWKPWTDFLFEDYGKDIEIINKSRSSFGQSLIIASLMEELILRDFDVDMVIVQWSAVARAYSTNQRDFFNRILTQGEECFAPYEEEYIINKEGYEGWLTHITKTVDLEYYTASIDKILLFKYLLDSKNIPYKMFWGWEQITPEIYQQRKKWIDLVYDENFWRFGEQGGMLEWIVDKIGKDNAHISIHNSHPTTQGHEIFYNEIIKYILKPIL
jgi:hypothetical protein